ncbi:MAG: ABC transporter permease [Gammaproteobacteria bacterium]|nr:ABC transporter permease [Gammaproteobacteria bacterium]MBU2058640.1 ABC transporter permease [Gammaproteobacteria bacterium]MBU2173592.1 ABC transporter permease [Gammaproteobacteria bacterium]MBU2246546.1 ABC transporter permease [Gammaproteobacteria bacterium]MBU2343219.1 ABC transporter permease [Gammaproteobacteria bacterium]
MKLWTIAVFEFQRYFKWKQELITVAILAAFLVFSALWPVVKTWLDNDYKIALVSQAAAPKVSGYSFSQIPADSAETAVSGIGDVWDLVVQVQNNKLVMTAQSSASWQEKLTPELQNWLQKQRIGELPLSTEQKEILDNLPDAQLVFLKKDSVQQNKEQKLVSGGLLLLMAVGVFSGFGFMFTAITTEKQQRVTEQLLTLISSKEWIDGKILGISLFCLKSMITTGLFFYIMLQAISMMKGKGFFVLPISPSELASALIFVSLGLLIINSFMAGFAATIDDPNHSSRSIIMFLPSLPLGVVFSAMDNAEGSLMHILSLFPLTSFAAMPMRMATVSVPWWEWLLSLLLLLACLFWLKNAASRVFELGIRMYGKEPEWSLLLKTFLFARVKD